MIFLTHLEMEERNRQFAALHNASQTKSLFKLHGMRSRTLILVGYKTRKKAMSLRDRPPYLHADPHALPSFFTSRAEVARLIGCGTRSVYNYLLLLEQAGVLRKTFHGHACNFEITLHPWFYHREGYLAPEVVDVERVVVADKAGQSAVREPWTRPLFTLPGAPGEGPPPDEGALPGSESGRDGDPPVISAGLAAAWEGVVAQAATSSAPSARSAGRLCSEEPQSTLRDFGRELTLLFWRQAQESLWPREYIAPDYERRLLNLVWSDVMGGFSGCEDFRQMSELYRVRLDQLTAAAGYARRQGWTSFLPPPLYFSYARFEQEKREDTRGSFWWTFEWFKKSEHARVWARRKHALNSITRKRAPRALNGGGEVGDLELYRYWEQRLAQQGDAELDRAFQQAVADLHARPGRPAVWAPSGGSKSGKEGEE